MAESKDLKKAVDAEAKKAEKDARTGDVETVPESEGGPMTDLATGERTHATPQ